MMSDEWVTVPLDGGTETSYAPVSDDGWVNVDLSQTADIQQGEPTTSIGDKALGVGETALTMLTGAAGQVAGGLSGMIDLAQGDSVDEAASNVKHWQEKLTYQPRTESGKDFTETLGEGFNWVIKKGADFGEAVAPEGSEIGGRAIGGAVTEAALNFLPFGLAAKGISKLKAPKIVDAVDVKATDLPSNSNWIEYPFRVEENVKKADIGSKEVHEATSNTQIDRVGNWLTTPFLKVLQAAPDSVIPQMLRKVDATRHYETNRWRDVANDLERLEIALGRMKVLPRIGGDGRPSDWGGRFKSSQQFKDFKQAWLENDLPRVHELAEAAMPGQGSKIIQKVRDTLDVRADQIRTVSKSFDGRRLDDYLPRNVKNLEKLNASMMQHSKVRSEWDGLYRSYKDGKISDLEFRKGLDDLLTKGGKPDIGMAQSGFMKRRRKLHDIDAYQNPADTLRAYYKETADVYAEGTFLGKHDAASEGIAAILAREKAEGRIPQGYEDKSGRWINPEDKIREALEGYFSPNAVKPPSAMLRKVKDIGYLGTIADFASAVTQIGDTIISIGRYGPSAIPAMLKAAVPTKTLRKKLGIVDLDDIGLVDIMNEINNNSSVFTPILEAGLRWSGFKQVDRFGKRTIANAAASKYRKMAKSNPQRLEKLGYKKLLGDAEFKKFVNDLKTGDLSNPNVRFAVFNDVAEVQPVAMADMPIEWLKHPNARIFYSLKTWSARTINRMREDIAHGIKYQGKDPKEAMLFGYGKAAAYFAGIYGATMSVDFAKMMAQYAYHDRDIQPEDIDALAVDSLLKSTGILSRYSLDKMAGGDTGGAVAATILPPAPGLLGYLAYDVYKAATDITYDMQDWKSIGTLPIGGRVIKSAAKPPESDVYKYPTGRNPYRQIEEKDPYRR